MERLPGTANRRIHLVLQVLNHSTVCVALDPTFSPALVLTILDRTFEVLQPLYEARLGCIPAGRPSNTQLMSYMGILIMLSVGSELNAPWPYFNPLATVVTITIPLLTGVTGIMVYVSWKRRQEIEGSESGFMSLPSLYDVLLRDGITFFASMCCE